MAAELDPDELPDEYGGADPVRGEEGRYLFWRGSVSFGGGSDFLGRITTDLYRKRSGAKMLNKRVMVGAGALRTES